MSLMVEADSRQSFKNEGPSSLLPAPFSATEAHISQLVKVLCERQQPHFPAPESNEDLTLLLQQDRESNRRWSGRVDRVLRICRWLGTWMPYHDLELLGQQSFDGLMDLFYYNLFHFADSSARSSFVNEYPELLSILRGVRDSLPVQTEPYRQQPCTPATAILRARYVLDRFPNARRTLLLGDDDLTSLALAWLASQEGHELELVVVDIDEDLLAALDKATRGWKVPVDARKVDLFSAEAETLKDFDVVLTDPSYEEAWIRQFTTFALRAMKQGCDFLLTFPEPLGHEWLQPWLQELKEEHQLTLLQRHEAFSEYPMLGNRREWLSKALRLLVPLPEDVLREYQSLPFTYSCLWHFQQPLSQ